MLKKLHKIIGLSVCLVVIHLSITGIVLMYPNTFRLQDTYYTNSLILKLYDMYQPTDVRYLEGVEDDVGVIKSKIITSDMVVDTGINNIIGVLKDNNLIFVFNNKKIILIKETDYQLELVKEKNIPFKAELIGKHNNKIIIRSSDGTNYFLDNNLSISILEDINLILKEKRLSLPDEEIANYYLSQVQGPGIQALRLFADLHNGRFFGSFVMFIFAISSIMVIFLSISGSYMAIRPSLKRYLYRFKKKNTFKQ